MFRLLRLLPVIALAFPSLARAQLDGFLLAKVACSDHRKEQMVALPSFGSLEAYWRNPTETLPGDLRDFLKAQEGLVLLLTQAWKAERWSDESREGLMEQPRSNYVLAHLVMATDALRLAEEGRHRQAWEQVLVLRQLTPRMFPDPHASDFPLLAACRKTEQSVFARLWPSLPPPLRRPSLLRLRQLPEPIPDLRGVRDREWRELTRLLDKALDGLAADEGWRKARQRLADRMAVRPELAETREKILAGRLLSVERWRGICLAETAALREGLVEGLFAAPPPSRPAFRERLAESFAPPELPNGTRPDLPGLLRSLGDMDLAGADAETFDLLDQHLGRYVGARLRALLSVDWLDLAQSHARLTARERLLRTGMALSLLEDSPLSPERAVRQGLLEAWEAQDPFSGTWLRLAVREGRASAYSVGANGRDEGGGGDDLGLW